MNDPLISLVIVSYNTRDLLRQCLASIQVHCPEAQVVVVDNASRDDSAEMVRDEFPHATLVTSTVNLGFAGANNLGLPHATGDFVVLLNSDTVLEDDALNRCAHWMLAHPEVGAVSPALIGVDGLPQRCFCRFASFANSLSIALRRPVPLPEGNRDPRSWLAGTALMIRRKALHDVGNALDDHYFMYWEDADLSARLRRAGWDLAVVPDTQIRHYGGASGGGIDEQRRPDLLRWNLYGKYRWFARHRGITETVGVWLLDWTNVVRMLIRAALHPSRRYNATQARVLAGALVRTLFGFAPSRPKGVPVVNVVPPRKPDRSPA